MAYCLRPDESIPDGLRRLARKELKSARQALKQTDPAKNAAIHAARKSIKKVRAIAQLIKADAGRGLGGCRKRLRRVNRTLSDLRDADAMLEILEKLKKKSPQSLDEHTVARIRRQLVDHQQSAIRAAHAAGTLKRLDRDLRKIRNRVEGWKPSHRKFTALALGIERAYRRGRKALRLARERQGAEDFHEWRKRTKTLWYHLRLIEGRAAVADDVKTLHRIEDWLGEEHNVAILCEHLATHGAADDLERLGAVTTTFQKHLRQQALSAATPFYRIAPGAYRRRVEQAWKKAGRTAGQSGRQRSRRAAPHRAA